MLKVLQGWAEVEAAEEEIALLPGPEPGLGEWSHREH